MIGRHIEGGLHEDFDITNNNQHPVRQSGKSPSAAIADIFEVMSDSHRAARPHRHVVVGQAADACAFHLELQRFYREVIVRTGEGDGEPAENTNGRLSFDVALKAGQAWHRRLIYDLADGAKRILWLRGNAPILARLSDHAGMISEWQGGGRKIETSNEEFYRRYTQGMKDMAASRLPLEGNRSHGIRPSLRGLPWFVALFGRDTHVSLQTMIVYPEFAAGARRCWPSIRRPSAMTIAMPSRARSCTSCAAGSSRTSS